MLDNDRHARSIILKEGRKLGYAEFGDLNGRPVFYFHGHRSSRLEPKMYGLETKHHSIRLIAVDRPGIGLSDYKKGHTFLDWPDDVVELADSLNINKFAVLGGSGGGPYALACAYKIPNRLTACGIVSGLGPIEFGTEGMMRKNRVELFLGRRFSWFLKFLFWLQGRILKGMKKKDLESVKEMFRKRSEDLNDPDREIMGDPERVSLWLELMSEPFRQGVKGLTHQGRLISKPWGFDLAEVSSSLKVFLWHGELDPSVPVGMARFVCEAIPNCEGKFYPNEGHISVAINKIEEILSTLSLQF